MITTLFQCAITLNTNFVHNLHINDQLTELNSGQCGCDLKCLMFKHILVIDNIHSEAVLAESHGASLISYYWQALWLR